MDNLHGLIEDIIDLFCIIFPVKSLLYCCNTQELDTIQDFRSKLGMKLWINWISRNNLSLTINLDRSTNIIKDLFHFFLSDC
jgi:hypothetical protein